MNDREKALESLLKERDYLVADYCDGNPRHKRLTNFLYAVRPALSSLSFEDAVKVVEEMIADYEMEETPQGAIKRRVIYDILTALRERGKGK